MKDLKPYLERLNNGEALEAVQADFVKDFADVSAAEIVAGEEALIAEGADPNQLTRLCDVHSAMFHGDQNEEELPLAKNATTKGHPLYILSKENDEILKRLDQVMDTIRNHGDVVDALEQLLPVNDHYDKKDELLLSTLLYHNVTGPSNVMWNVDGEIRKTLKKLVLSEDKPETIEVIMLVNRMKEMIFKENRILFPLTEAHFTKEEWTSITHDMDRFGYAYISERPYVLDDEPKQTNNGFGLSMDDARITLPTGSMTLKELATILDALPLELTFIDKNNLNRYFSSDSSLFPRPLTALNHPVFDCHPPKVIPVVKKVIGQLKSGEKDVVSFTAMKKGHKVHVRYLALRHEGEYLGVLEAVERLDDLD